MVRVKCMKPTSSNMRNFRWPDEEDAVFYDDKDIICTIDPPLANGDFCRGEPVLSFKRSTECSKEGLWKPYFKIRLNQCTIFANNFSYDFILLTKRGRLFLIKIKSLVATQTCIWLLRVYRCRGVDAFQNTARHHHLECSLSLSFKWIQDFSVSIYKNYSTILINIQFALLVLPTISTAFGWLKGLRKATHHIL